MDGSSIKHSKTHPGYYEELDFVKQRNNLEKVHTSKSKINYNQVGQHENNKVDYLYAKINKLPQKKKSKNTHGNNVQTDSKDKDLALKLNNVEALGKLNKKFAIKSKHTTSSDEMNNDCINVEQGTSKDKTVCSDNAKLGVSKSTNQTIATNKAICGYTSDAGLPLLYNLYTCGEHNSSIAFIETDNLREGLKSIDNPIFEVFLLIFKETILSQVDLFNMGPRVMAQMI